MYLRRTGWLCLLATIGLCCLSTPASATNYFWTGATSDLSTSTNWNPNGLPTSADSVFFTDAGGGGGGVNPTTGTLANKFFTFEGTQSYNIGGTSLTVATGGNIDDFNTSATSQEISVGTLTFTGTAQLLGSGGSTTPLLVDPGTMTMGSGAITATTTPFTIAPTTGTLGTGTILANGATIAINGGTISKASGTIQANASSPITIAPSAFNIASTGNAILNANGANITVTPTTSITTASRSLTLTGGSNVLLNGGLGGAAGTAIKTGLGNLSIGSSGSWAGVVQLGTSVSTSYGNIQISAADALGAVGSAASGYTDLGPSKAGALVVNTSSPISIGEFIYVRGRAANNTPQIENAAGTNTFTGTITLDTAAGSGTNVTLQSDAGLLTLSSTSSLVQALASQTLNHIGVGNGEIDGAITETTGSWSVFKDGAGTWTIGGTQSYTGTTTVNGGTLILNGTHTGGGLYTVASGATLGGSGSTASTVDLSGVLSPGNSPGTLAVGGLTLENGSSANFDLVNTSGIHPPGSGNDYVNISGLLSASGSPSVAINVAAIGGGLLGTGTSGVSTWVLATYGSLSGAASFSVTGCDPAYSPTVSVGGGQVLLTLTAPVPEPSTFVLAGMGILGLAVVRLRKRK